MNNRLGFHYFPDKDHFQAKDLKMWLPELIDMNISWLLLESPTACAIPEEFIFGLKKNKIEPIIHFNFLVNSSIKPEDIRVILNAYSRWGVKYVVFFDKPNLRSSWTSGSWSQGDLVDRFLDRYIPFAKLAVGLGIIPIIPPLQPGGDYWDTSFLRKMLLLLEQRKELDLLTDIHVAVSGQTFGKSIDWGSGGAKRWQPSVPYKENIGDHQNHIGLNTYEWYSEICENLTGAFPKCFIFWLGATDLTNSKEIDPKISFNKLKTMVNSHLSQNPEETRAFNNNVISCLYWMLNSYPNTTIDKDFQGHYVPIKNKSTVSDPFQLEINEVNKDPLEMRAAKSLASWVYTIDHYLLLPKYEWGIPEHILERARPIIREKNPTVGFSLDEASNARKVTVWNENYVFSDNDLNFLRNSGCEIEEILTNKNAEVIF